MMMTMTTKMMMMVMMAVTTTMMMNVNILRNKTMKIMIKTTILFYDIPVAEVMCNGRMDLRKLSEDVV